MRGRGYDFEDERLETWFTERSRLWWNSNRHLVRKQLLVLALLLVIVIPLRNAFFLSYTLWLDLFSSVYHYGWKSMGWIVALYSLAALVIPLRAVLDLFQFIRPSPSFLTKHAPHLVWRYLASTANRAVWAWLGLGFILPLMVVPDLIGFLRWTDTDLLTTTVYFFMWLTYVVGLASLLPQLTVAFVLSRWLNNTKFWALLVVIPLSLWLLGEFHDALPGMTGFTFRGPQWLIVGPAIHFGLLALAALLLHHCVNRFTPQRFRSLPAMLAAGGGN